MIEDQIREQDVNFICLWIDSPGGSLVDSMNLANFLADLDREQGAHRGLCAGRGARRRGADRLACDQLVMNHDAVLGGSGAEEFSADDVQLARETLRDSLAPKKSRSWSLTAALVDPELRVYRYTHKRDGMVEYFCDAELQSPGRSRRLDARRRSDQAGRAAAR